MKKIAMKNVSLLLIGAFLFSVVFTSCKKKNNDVQLPPIGGYNNSDEVGAANLVAYWNFDGNQNEIKSGTAATSSDRVTSFCPV